MKNSLIFYIIIQLLSMLLFYLGIKKSDKSKRIIFIILSAMLLILVIGLRSITTGADTLSYAAVLNRYVNGYITNSDKNWIGNGYFFIFYITKIFFGYNYVALNFIIGFLTIYFIYKFILDNSKNLLLSLFLFFSTCLYLQCLNQSRQMLSIAIVLYSYKYIKEKNFKKYSLFILLAASIHNSALITLPFYFINKFKLDKKIIFIYILLGIVVFIGFDFFKELLLLTSYGKIYIAANYMTESKMSSYLNLIVRILLLLFTLFFKKSSLKSDKNNNYLYHMAFITLITQIITLKIYIFGRITTYFFAFYIISLPNLMANIENKFNKKFYTSLVIILFILYFFVYYKFVSISSGYDIYSFFWK